MWRLKHKRGRANDAVKICRKDHSLKIDLGSNNSHSQRGSVTNNRAHFLPSFFLGSIATSTVVAADRIIFPLSWKISFRVHLSFPTHSSVHNVLASPGRMNQPHHYRIHLSGSGTPQLWPVLQAHYPTCTPVPSQPQTDLRSMTDCQSCYQPGPNPRPPALVTYPPFALQVPILQLPPSLSRSRHHLGRGQNHCCGGYLWQPQ
jgi:hypothetical protein